MKRLFKEGISNKALKKSFYRFQRIFLMIFAGILSIIFISTDTLAGKRIKKSAKDTLTLIKDSIYNATPEYGVIYVPNFPSDLQINDTLKTDTTNFRIK